MKLLDIETASKSENLNGGINPLKKADQNIERRMHRTRVHESLNNSVLIPLINCPPKAQYERFFNSGGSNKTR